MPTNSFPCPFCRRVFKSAGPFDKHLHARHSEQAGHLYKSRRSCDEPFEELNEDRDRDIIRPDFVQSLLDSNYNTIHEGTNDSDCKSDSELCDEVPLLPGEDSRIEDFDGAGRSFGTTEKGLKYAETSAELLAAPWHPFRNAIEFKLARFFLQSGTSQQSIDSFLKSSLAPAGVGFGSAYTICPLLDSMKTALGPESWNCGEVTMAGRRVPFYYRKPLDCIRYLLQQKAYSAALVFGPQRRYEGAERQYGELHTADWWWEVQVWYNSSMLQ